MKSIINICLLLLLAVFAHANEIDSLTTKRDVEHFLATKIDTNWKYVSPFEANKVHTCKFTKAGFLKKDFDGNGLTDLLIYGQNCFVVLDFDSMPYGLQGNYMPPYNITLGESGAWFVDIVNVKEDPLLIFKDYVWQYDTKSWAPTYDTFIFKFGFFVEYNPNPGQLKFKEITFKSIGCHSCYGDFSKRFEMKIDTNRWATYGEFGYDDYRIFAGEIDSVNFYDLAQIINYINFISLDDLYDEGNAMGVTVHEIEIKFTNGQYKKVRYYGRQGTTGLYYLHDKLLNLGYSLNELY